MSKKKATVTGGDPSGRSYELLVAAVFQTLLAQEKVENVLVQQNVTIAGITGSHQIDVYWEFVFAGITHRVVVQAKDWNKKVEQGEVLKLKAVLDDIPHQPRGIFVSAKGYQRGASKIAKARGIELYTLIQDEDKPLIMTVIGWMKVRALSVVGNYQLLMEVETFNPVVKDMSWLADPASLTEDERSAAKKMVSNELELPVYDAAGNVVTTVAAIVRAELAKVRSDPPKKLQIDSNLPNESFVRPWGVGGKSVRVFNLNVNIEIEREKKTRTWKADGVVNFILSNVLTGEQKHLMHLSEKR